ncbi:hypothetical protein THII_0113 [Thioploca ingrica]|uniref:Sugar kinase n=1 Tax=Thioploca ingrica TaxID=40754 RepID=A0A090AI15_9GAMM|nr:hypothetical protein THII_0113 [Thioploca ingrica]
MQRATENKIILVIRHTRLNKLMARFSSLAQSRFYVEHQGADFSEYLEEDKCYQSAITKAMTVLSALGRVQKVDRSFLPNFVFAEQDTIVVLGQDGLVANTVKYLTGQPVIGVNPDPQRWEGILLPFQLTDLVKVVPEVFARRRLLKEVTMAKVKLNNGQYLYGVNDLFIGTRSHTSALYQIKLGHQTEHHSSSGVIVSTGLGSTGWFKSLLTGALGITKALLDERLSQVSTRWNHDLNCLNHECQTGMAWDADFLHFIVREPFPSMTSSANLVFGQITAKQPLQLTSQMSENGVIFSDGIESDFLEFNSGTQAKITLAEKKGYLVV